MQKKKDRRIQRTQQVLEASLLALIKEKPFDAISVREIIDRANVGRATFYAHYENKEDLLQCGFYGLQQTLREQQREARSRHSTGAARLLAFSHHLFAHAHEHRAVFPAIAGKRGSAVVQHVLRKMLLEIVREDVKAAVPAGTDPAHTEATIQFIANGLLGLLTWWLTGRVRLTIDEMDTLFRRIAIPALESII